MITRNELTEIGKFQRTHALKGELNALFEMDPESIVDAERPIVVNMDGIFVPFFIASIRPKGSYSFLVKLTDVDSEEAARSFVNKDIYALSADVDCMDPDAEGTYADALIGYSISDVNAGSIGKVTDLDLTTENALFIVTTPDESVIYVPIADELIEEIDDNNKTILMSLPDGLVTINQKS